MKNLILIATILISQSTFASIVKIKMETSHGDIFLELNSAKAPKTVANFVKYTKAGFYNGTVFHRVISNFMIQGGGFLPNMTQKTTNAPIMNEANNKLSNSAGTIAMARTSNPNSATSQFFINVVDNGRLDYQGPGNYGYAVFGRVTKGMTTVNKIKSVATGSQRGFHNVPTIPVIIKKVSVQ